MVTDLYSESYEELAIRAYSQKDYERSGYLCRKHLENNKDFSSVKLEKVFFRVEPNLFVLDKYLESKKTGKSKHIEPLLLTFLEKASIAGNAKLGKKWGTFFLNEFSKSRSYAKGLYHFASLLVREKDYDGGNRVLKSIPMGSIRSKSQKRKIFLLSLASLEKDQKIIRNSKQYLKKYYHSNYSDYILALLIESYRHRGKEKIANHLIKKFQEDFPTSPFRNMIGI